jgi:hypothetical protein
MKIINAVKSIAEKCSKNIFSTIVFQMEIPESVITDYV